MLPLKMGSAVGLILTIAAANGATGLLLPLPGASIVRGSSVALRAVVNSAFLTHTLSSIPLGSVWGRRYAGFGRFTNYQLCV